MDNWVGKVFKVWHWSKLMPFWEEIIIARGGAGVENEGLECIVRYEMRRTDCNGLGGRDVGNGDNDAVIIFFIEERVGNGWGDGRFFT